MNKVRIEKKNEHETPNNHERIHIKKCKSGIFWQRYYTAMFSLKASFVCACLGCL